ncbi:MAG: GGDEF domain-containing protein [Lachnospiraceae bacterium]|nr:GGDEF domain-containing protein [Lachnospiraceae bacterium]
MQINQEFVSHKKNLSRSITLGCISFILALCIVMGFMSYYSYRNALYSRYRSYITDILNYVDRHIDDEDLAKCTETLEPSAKYSELLAFMDGIMEDFSIHYLYILKPLPDRVHLVSIIDAQTYYKRNVDTEGNLYLGWVSNDEYAPEDVEALADILQNEKDIVFTEETTEWGTDFTGILPLEAEPGMPYGIAVIDLNFLKKINDTYGHDKGNISIVKLSRMVCSAFAHSPVFRIGGDEFAVILMEHDLQHIEELRTALEEALRISAESENLQPWERISAAIGYAVFDGERDHEVEDVFRRADENMYTRKKEMKAARE